MARQPFGQRRSAWVLALVLGLEILLAGSLRVPAASVTNELVAVRSNSQQFIVHGKPLKREQALTATLSGEIRLDPSLVAVSCERIKQALLQELEAPDRYRNKIHVILRSTTTTNAPLDLQPVFLGSSWQIRLYTPDTVLSTRFVRAVVQALLMEMANRQSGPRFTEIPLWLTEGFTGHLMESSGRDLVLEAEKSTVRLAQKQAPRHLAQERLRPHRPISFNELSFPTAERLQGTRWETYHSCAQLLVVELLNLRNGRADLRELLLMLSRHHNWQIAFLQAFHPHFQNLLAVEKWWALVLANSTGREEPQGWSPLATLDTLDEIVSLPAQIRYASNALPAATRVPLQKLIEFWGFETQRELLQWKITQLRSLRLIAAPRLAPLIQAYETTLAGYVEKRQFLGRNPAGRAQESIRPRLLLNETLRELDRLDAQRQALRR